MFTRDAVAISLGLLENSFAPLRIFVGYFQGTESFDKTSKLNTFFFFLFGLVQITALAVLLFRRNSIYLAHRDKIMFLHLITRIAAYWVFVFNSDLRWVVQPKKMPESTRGAILHLIRLPYILAQSGLRYLSPLGLWSFTSLIGIVLILRLNPSQCIAEISSNAGQGRRYQMMANGVENFLYGWLPLPCSRTGKGNSFFARSLSEMGACIAVRSWLQVGLI